MSESFTRWIGIGNSMNSLEVPRHLHFKDFETDPRSGKNHETTRWVDTDHHLLEVRWRDSHEMWVHLRRDDGIELIERWKVNRIPGAWFAERPAARTEIGLPLPLVQSPEPAIEGGEFILPRFRTKESTYWRKEMYRAEPGNSIVSYDIDPDGRFLIVIDDDYGIRQVPTDGHSVTHWIPGSSTLPTGGVRLDSVSISCDPNLGRILVASAGRQGLVCMYVDANNDGVFGVHRMFDYPSYKAIEFDWLMQGEY